MNPVLHEDGRGKIVNSLGENVYMLEVETNDTRFALDNVTNFTEYVNHKSLSTLVQARKDATNMSIHEPIFEKANGSIRKAYKRYKKEDIDNFLSLVNDEGMSVCKAARKLKVPLSTACNWCKKSSKDLGRVVQPTEVKNKRCRGRAPTLTGVHRSFLTALIGSDVNITLNKMMDRLVCEFKHLKVSRTSLYNFATNKCKITFKKSYSRCIVRNSPSKIEERYEWAKNWFNVGLNYENNCVFVDEAGFRTNLERSLARSRKEIKSNVNVSENTTDTTILGAISPYGMVNI
ncbi:MAG: hypothetical protein EXX96DRAFT_458153, partial [Benjaminiella poitrasii]